MFLSCRSLLAQGDLTVLFRSGFSASFKEWLPSLWPSFNSMNKAWGRTCFQRTLRISSVKSDQHICTAVSCASLAAKTSAPMLYRDKWVSGKHNMWECTFHCTPLSAGPDSLGTNTPKSCWNLLAAEMPLHYRTLPPVLPAFLYCHFPPLLQHHWETWEIISIIPAVVLQHTEHNQS